MAEENPNRVYTITCGDGAENHTGNQMLGELGPPGSGFTWQEFAEAIPKFEAFGAKCRLIGLDKYQYNEDPEVEEAPKNSLLLVRGGIDAVLKYAKSNKTHEDALAEMDAIDCDEHFLDTRTKKVKKKHARKNVCFDNKPQSPSVDNPYADGKGTIVAWDTIPVTKTIHENLDYFIGPKAKNLKGELNKYDDAKINGIGGHGDGERRRVVMWRLGIAMAIAFRAHRNWRPIGRGLKIILNGGDMLFMSENATGWDWKLTKNQRVTWRHAAGAEKYLYQLTEEYYQQKQAATARRKAREKARKADKKK